jgi:hypothetical protein
MRFDALFLNLGISTFARWLRCRKNLAQQVRG